jgi:hypothetical protein
MDQALPGQSPAVVLRSRYTLVRALLGIASVAVVALTVAVVVLANDESDAGGSSSASPTHSINYGGFSPNSGRPESAPQPRGRSRRPSRAPTIQGPPSEEAPVAGPAVVGSLVRASQPARAT